MQHKREAAVKVLKRLATQKRAVLRTFPSGSHATTWAYVHSFEKLNHLVLTVPDPAQRPLAYAA